MPRLGDIDLETFNLQTSHYGFSAERIDNLKATEYTLVTILLDLSSSTLDFRKEIKDCLNIAIESCKKHPRSDNLLIRVITFADSISEVHGFRQLQTINPDEYNSILDGGGMTALYDAVINGVEAMSSYGKSLTESDFSVNAICFILTDGVENRSKHSEPSSVKKTLQEAIRSESLESLVSILIGVNLYPDVESFLKSFKEDAGIDQFLNIGDASATTLAKVGNFFSKSISSQSQSLGSGSGASQQIKQNASITF